MTTKAQTHEKGVNYVACNLIENNIATRTATESGIDLILDNGKTILVRAMNEEMGIALMNGSLDKLKADYVIAVTNLKYKCTRKVYIMTIDEAKGMVKSCPYRANNRDNWFIELSRYGSYREHYDSLHN